MIATYPNNKQAEYMRLPYVPKRKDINLHVPDDGHRYVQFKHDFEVWDGQVRQQVQGSNAKGALPAIVNKDGWGLRTFYNGVEYDYVTFPKAWQFWLFEIFRWAVDDSIPIGKIEYFYQKPGNARTFAYATPGTLTWVWVNMMEAHRAWTESASIEAGFQDYVTGRNPHAMPFALLLRSCTGNIARVTRDLGGYWELEALDILKPPPPISHVVSDPALLHWATQVTVNKLPDGRYVVSNFPQVEAVSEIHNLPFMGTPMPLFSMGGTIQIRKTGVKLLQPGQAYSIYVPEI